MLDVVFFVAVGSAALANATDLWRQITVTSTVVCLLLVTLSAVFSQDRDKFFAGGFALTGWLYMTLAFVSAFGVRDDLLTDNTIVVQHNGNWSRALGDNRRLARGRERTLVATKG